jgi:molecular chaperone GrpE
MLNSEDSALNRRISETKSMFANGIHNENARDRGPIFEKLRMMTRYLTKIFVNGNRFSGIGSRITIFQKRPKTKDPVREQILQRFTNWLDNVLAEEKPLEGIAAELLFELKDGNGSEPVGPADSTDDLYSTWSAMTALTQEVKLQGRAFKQLSDSMDPLTGLSDSIDRLLVAHKEALADPQRIAEKAHEILSVRENRLKLEAQDRARRGLLEVVIDIRDRLIIGLRSASESRLKLDEYLDSSWLNRIFVNKRAGINHMLEIVSSLKKGYRLGLDRLDETLQQLEVHEIECEGQPFDPRVMNAVDIKETVEVPDGMVLEVYRTGYLIDNEVLRSAQVKVARAPLETS